MACTITSYWYITLLSLSPVVVTFTEAEGNPCWFFFLVSYSLNPCFLLSFINFCSSGLGSQVLSEQWTVTGLLLKWKSMMRLDVHSLLLFFFVSGTSRSGCLTAALGNTWSHSVNTRLILQYLGSEGRQVSALTTFSDCQGQGTRCTSNLGVHLLKALAVLSVLGQRCQKVGKETSLPAYLNSSSNKLGR